MPKKPTYEELKQKVKELEKEAADRRSAEEALERKITELNSFINNIPDMAWLKDAESRFIAVNSAFGKAVGVAPEFLINKGCEVCFGKKAAKKFREDDQKVMKGRRQEIIEEKIVASQKNEVWLETIKSPIISESGELAGTVGIARDITERKRAQERLSQLNEIFVKLGLDPEKNIHSIVEQTCAILEGACSLYNRLDDKEKSLHAWSAYNTPPDFDRADTPDGHICYEATIKGQDKPVVIEDLEGTEYEETDPNVKKYGLRSYLGYPVLLGGKAIGSLCIVDTEPRKFTTNEIDIISTLAKAVSLEEERMRAERALKEKEEELEIKAKNLEEVNIALRVLLKQREGDKAELEEKVLSNVKDLVLPYLERLKKSSLDRNQMSCVRLCQRRRRRC